jgi:uncharacterized membrane protein
MTKHATDRHTSLPTTGTRSWVVRLARHWLLIVNTGYGIFIGLTAVAPTLLMLGLTGPAWLLYRAYALNCHQLPQRSYYLFGPHGIDTYSLDQVLAWGADPNHLRNFVGNADIGFKMAMAHRNTAIFAAIFLVGLVYASLRPRVKGLSWKWYVALMAPMVVDGTSHMISELTGLGFRQTNAWAAWLTGGVLGAGFYVGTTVGTLNWLLRTLTGALAGLASVWLLYPRIDQAFRESIATTRAHGSTFERWQVREPVAPD